MADLETLTVGDTSDHGGQIITGDSSVNIKGKSVAVIGSLFSCPLFYPDGQPHSITPIVIGASVPSRIQVPSGIVAVEGDRAMCGCILKSANAGLKTSTCVGIAAVAVSVLALGASFLYSRNRNSGISTNQTNNINPDNNLTQEQNLMIDNRVGSMENFVKKYTQQSSPNSNIPAQQKTNGPDCNCD